MSAGIGVGAGQSTKATQGEGVTYGLGDDPYWSPRLDLIYRLAGLANQSNAQANLGYGGGGYGGSFESVEQRAARERGRYINPKPYGGWGGYGSSNPVATHNPNGYGQSVPPGGGGMVPPGGGQPPAGGGGQPTAGDDVGNGQPPVPDPGPKPPIPSEPKRVVKAKTKTQMVILDDGRKVPLAELRTPEGMEKYGIDPTKGIRGRVITERSDDDFALGKQTYLEQQRKWNPNADLEQLGKNYDEYAKLQKKLTSMGDAQGIREHDYLQALEMGLTPAELERHFTTILKHYGPSAFHISHTQLGSLNLDENVIKGIRDGSYTKSAIDAGLQNSIAQGPGNQTPPPATGNPPPGTTGGPPKRANVDPYADPKPSGPTAPPTEPPPGDTVPPNAPPPPGPPPTAPPTPEAPPGGPGGGRVRTPEASNYMASANQYGNYTYEQPQIGAPAEQDPVVVPPTAPGDKPPVDHKPTKPPPDPWHGGGGGGGTYGEGPGGGGGGYGGGYGSPPTGGNPGDGSSNPAGTGGGGQGGTANDQDGNEPTDPRNQPGYNPYYTPYPQWGAYRSVMVGIGEDGKPIYEQVPYDFQQGQNEGSTPDPWSTSAYWRPTEPTGGLYGAFSEMAGGNLTNYENSIGDAWRGRAINPVGWADENYMQQLGEYQRTPGKGIDEAYNAYKEMINSNGYTPAQRGAIEGSAVRGITHGYQRSADEIRRQAARTGNAQSAYAALAGSGAKYGADLGEINRQNQIKFADEAQRRKEAGAGGMTNVAGLATTRAQFGLNQGAQYANELARRQETAIRGMGDYASFGRGLQQAGLGGLSDLYKQNQASTANYYQMIANILGTPTRTVNRGGVQGGEVSGDVGVKV